MLKNELNKPKSESTNNVERNKLEEINDDAKALNLTIEYVNEWVKDHPGTDPNYYEFIELLVSFGRLTSAATKYFEGKKCCLYCRQESKWITMMRGVLPQNWNVVT